MIATTAFCTVDRVTSAGRLISLSESSWVVQDMPNREVAGELSVSLHCSVKYEKSSVDLMECERSQLLPVSQASSPLSLFSCICLLSLASNRASYGNGTRCSIRMSSVRQRHERQQCPVILLHGVDAIVAEPELDLGPSIRSKAVSIVSSWGAGIARIQSIAT